MNTDPQKENGLLGEPSRRQEVTVKLEARRRILEWLGLGALGAIVLRVIPVKRTIAKRILREKDEKISISINPNAVKRTRKATGNA